MWFRFFIEKQHVDLQKKTVCTEGYVMHIRLVCLHIQTDYIRKHLLR